MEDVIAEVLDRCRAVFPQWRDVGNDEFEWDPPKGFSSFTLAIRCARDVKPRAVLYRGLEGKDNAILDSDQEREVFLLLGEQELAPHCYHYGAGFRIEEFYDGRTLRADDLDDADTLLGIARELYRFHGLRIEGLPEQGFFQLLHEKWGRLGQAVLVDQRDMFPPEEQAMCDALMDLYSEATVAMVQRCLPKGPMVLCHNDTYHGNVMKLRDGRIKLLDLEFSCLNHAAYDFSNLFAETVMEHGYVDPPHFRIAEPEYSADDIATLVGHYLDCGQVSGATRDAELKRLVDETEHMILLSHYMYAMAAVPLAVDPIQKIRFIPYAYERWNKFQDLYHSQFG